jgi:hypothetical protein
VQALPRDRERRFAWSFVVGGGNGADAAAEQTN